MKYTIGELRKLRDIRAVPLDEDFVDDEYNTEYGFFIEETDTFFDWLEKMEAKGKINELLNR